MVNDNWLLVNLAGPAGLKTCGSPRSLGAYYTRFFSKYKQFFKNMGNFLDADFAGYADLIRRDLQDLQDFNFDSATEIVRHRFHGLTRIFLASPVRFVKTA